MSYLLYQCIFLFLIYSFLGWCCEVTYHFYLENKFINRGFLDGPICPIYGFGVVLVLYVLKPLNEQYFLLFLGSVILTTLLELFTGYAMEKIFKTRWWDYSDRKYNFKGYICLRFSLIWGILCFLIVAVVDPFIEELIEIIPYNIGIWAVSIFSIIFIADIVISVVSITQFNKYLAYIEDILESMNTLTGNIEEKITSTKAKTLESLDEKMSHYKKLIEEYEATIESMKLRFFESFPNIRSIEHKEALEKVKQYIVEKRK